MFAVLPLLLALPAYAFICLRLYSGRFRSGLNLAISMGSAVLVPGIMLCRFALTWDRRWWVLGNLVLLLLMHVVLIALAVKTYIHLPPLRPPDELLESTVYGFFLFVLFWIFYSPVPVRISVNEGVAMRYLEGLAIAAQEDSSKHAGLYPESLGRPRLDSSPECTVPSPFISGSTPDYIFEYRGIGSSIKSQGCTRFEGFTITARPVVYGRTGVRSFCIRNRTLAIHVTSENRAPRDSDPTDYVRYAPN